MSLAKDMVEVSFRLGEPELILLRNMIRMPSRKFLPFFIRIYKLQRLLPFCEISDLNNAISWSDKNGLEVAINKALEWVDYPIRSISLGNNSPGPRWATYSLVLSGKRPGASDINSMIGVCKLSAPVRSKLTRIAHKDHDLRRMSLSSGNSLLSVSPLGNDSGVYFNNIQVAGLADDQ